MSDNIFKIDFNDMIEVTVKKRLNILDSLSFVSAVVFSLIDEESQTVNYTWKEYNIRQYTIQFYTDFELPKYDGEDMSKVEENLNCIDFILFDSGIYEKIVFSGYFNKSHYDELIDSINKQLDFEVGKILKASKLDELFDTVIGLVNKVDVEKLNKALTKLGGIKGITEKGLVDAVIDKRTPKKKDKKNGSVIPLEKGQISADDVLNGVDKE